MSEEWKPPPLEALAGLAGAAVPAAGKIIRKAWVISKGERWVFEVSKHPVGTYEGIDKKRQGQRTADSATVLALFETGQFRIVTDKGLRPGVKSEWANPTWPGDLQGIEYF